MDTLVLVEDDPTLGDGIALALRSEQLQVVVCRSCSAARKAFADEPTLAVLDVNLPDGSGLDLLREIRVGSAMPVILLTANDLETDIVAGLEHGADDYITKPFSLAVLRARVNTQLRRIKQKKIAAGCVLIDEFRFDFDGLAFSRAGAAIELSKTEQKLLRVLVENRGQTVLRQTLLERVWADGTEYVDENALSVGIKRLRDKLEMHPARPQYIKTVYGIGYTWVGRNHD